MCFIKKEGNNMAKKSSETVIEAAQVETVEAVETAEVKKETKKEATKKAAPKKETAKKETAAKKTTAKKEVVADIYIEFACNQVSEKNVTERIKAAYVEGGHRASSIKSLRIYIKPEENAAYYVINDDNVGRVDLFV